MANLNNQYSTLEDNIKAEGALVISDYHGHSTVLSESLRIAANDDLALIVNGDVIGDYSFPELAAEFGYQTPENIQMEFLYNKTQEQGSRFGQNDLETYILLRNLQQTGGNVDPFLENVPEEHRAEARKSLEDVISYGQSDLFRKKMEDASQEFVDKEMPKVQENVLGMQALYQVFIDEEAKRFANELNKYSDTKVLFNLGNHEPVYFVEQVKQHLDNPNQIVDVTNTQGYIRLENSRGDELSIAGMTNCGQTMPYLSEIFSPQEMSFLYNHMDSGNFNENDYYFEDVSKDEIESSKLVAQDRHYQRIKKGEDSSVDVFLTHGQVGKALLSEGREGRPTPYYKSAGKLSLESKLTVEGHIHNKFDGENSLGQRMVRAAGEDAAVIKKQGDEVIVDKWVKINDSFDGNHHNAVPYDRQMLAARVEDLLEQYKTQALQNEEKQAA